MILLQVNSLKSSTYSVYSQKHFGIDTQPYCTRTHTYAHYNYLHILLDVQYEFKALRNVYIRRVSLYHQCISIFVHTTSTNASSISPFRCFLLYDVIIFFIIIASYPFVWWCLFQENASSNNIKKRLHLVQNKRAKLHSQKSYVGP